MSKQARDVSQGCELLEAAPEKRSLTSGGPVMTVHLNFTGRNPNRPMNRTYVLDMFSFYGECSKLKAEISSD